MTCARDPNRAMLARSRLRASCTLGCHCSPPTRRVRSMGTPPMTAPFCVEQAGMSFERLAGLALRGRDLIAANEDCRTRFHRPQAHRGRTARSWTGWEIRIPEAIEFFPVGVAGRGSQEAQMQVAGIGPSCVERIVRYSRALPCGAPGRGAFPGASGCLGIDAHSSR